LVRGSLCPDTGVSVSTNDRHLEHHQITRVTKRAAAVLTINDVYILKFNARGHVVTAVFGTATPAPVGGIR
jgi:hypothetical protein